MDIFLKKLKILEFMFFVLMASFSGKLYGMRSKKNKTKEKEGKTNENKGNKKNSIRIS